MDALPLATLATWLRLIAFAVGAGLALFLVSLLVWTARDAAARSGSVALRLGALLIVLALNVLGLVIYVLLRPPETLAERRERELVEALLTRDAVGLSAPTARAS